MRAAFGKAARIEGDDAIGLPQPLGYLSDQHCHQWAMLPWRNADEVLDELSFHIDQGGDFLGVLALQMGPQSLEGEVHGVGGLALKRLLGGPDALGETIRHLVEDVGADETIAP
jgi:hypothetical protein